MLRSIVLVALVFGGTVTAHADDEGSKEKPLWGMGVKVRRAWVTPYIQKLFMGDVPGTAKMDGAGFDFTRRKGDSEVVFSFGYDRLDAIDGYYLEKGGDPLVPGKVDYTTFHNPHWYTVEFGVVNHLQIHKFLEFRYGAGIGLGLVRGKILRTSAICTSSNIQSDCVLDPLGSHQNTPADVPPVLPVVDVLLGIQFRPFQFLHIHLDAGLHTVP
jgi:hypothetical protein